MLTNRIECVLTGADIAASLRQMEHSGITLLHIDVLDQLTVQFTVSRKEFSIVQNIADRRGDALQIQRKTGYYWYLRQIWKRPVLVIGLIMLITLSLWVPGRIFFISVEGNDQVYTNRILEEASHCGIHFGAARRQVRSEKMKNSLLQRLPQLQWAGVNTRGCVAVISVRERTPPPVKEEGSAVSSIVAARDGVIQNLTVTSGTAMCKPGDAVKAGQVLISGFTDYGNFVRAGRGEGEVFAQTFRNQTVYAMTNCCIRQEKSYSAKKYGMLFGKKRINFNNSSGISDTTCVKIYTEQYVTLPGGFVLPVAFFIEEVIFAPIVSDSPADTQSFMHSFITSYLQSQMVAGQILHASTVFTDGVEVSRLDGRFDCVEMIGMIRTEENLLQYEDH